MKRLLLKAKNVVGEKTNRESYICNDGLLSFDSQYRVLREHLRLCGIGYGIPHDFFDFGEVLLDRWSHILSETSFLNGSTEEIKNKLREEFKSEPSRVRNRVRIKVCSA